jgi:hypothetical protein
VRKPIAASLATAVVISAGLGAAAASAATPSSTPGRDRSGSLDRHSAARHDLSQDKAHGREAADR